MLIPREIPDCTLVTSCFNLSKYHNGTRSLDECIKLMTPLLEVPCYLVIFCDKTCYELIKDIRDYFDLDKLTYYFVLDFENLRYYKYIDIIKSNRESYWPTRDHRTCPESHLVCCSKFDFVLRTIELDPFKTSKFSWIDAYNVKKICENYNYNILLDVLHKTSDKFHLQILNVCDKKYKSPDNKREYYQQYRWVACGGFFVTGKDIGIKILTRLNNIFEETTIEGYGHGEEMFYLEVLDEFYDDIERSYGDYGQLLNNLLVTTKNFEYIYSQILKKYLDFNYHKECYDCCKKILNQIEKYNVVIPNNVYFLILFTYYVCAFYHKPYESYKIANNIYDLCNKNIDIKNEFKKKEEFYKSQLEYANKFKKKSRVIFCIFACATNMKYKNELIKINETWGKKAEEKGLTMLYFLGEEPTDLIGEKYVYFKNVLNDYSSAAYKQNLGLKYIYENYNADFIFICGTDTYVNIENLLTELNNCDKNKNVFIGGHGDHRMIGNEQIYFHSGAGFIISNFTLKNIYPDITFFHENWKNICNAKNKNHLIDACDVEMSYFLQKKNVEIIKNPNFYSCNYKGYSYNYTYECCAKNINAGNIIACHNMSLTDFDEYTRILENDITK